MKHGNTLSVVWLLWKLAENEGHMLKAINEFKKATEIAPTMAIAWYNLGFAQAKAGKFKEAIVSYRQYVALSPGAQDAQQVKDEIIKMEYRIEQTEKVRARDGPFYCL